MRGRLYLTLLMLGLGLGGPASAQTLDAQRRDVESAEQAARAAAERQAQAEVRADQAKAQAEATAARAVRLAARIQANERQASAIEARIAKLERQQRAQRARIANAQGEVVHLLAAIETYSRRPRALLIVQPERTTNSARAAALLDAVMPVLRARTAGLRREIARSTILRRALDRERGRQARVQADLARDARMLAAVEATQRRLAARLSDVAAAAAERAARLAADAQDLRALLDRLTHGPQIASGTRIRMPVIGRLTLAYGMSNDTGVHARGVSFATRPGAQVVAPAAGRIAFAGPFRTYGRIVIIEHDNGMLSLLAGLGSITVEPGRSVAAGAPVGRMGGQRPELYLELRDGGTPVDPMRHLSIAL